MAVVQTHAPKMNREEAVPFPKLNGEEAVPFPVPFGLNHDNPLTTPTLFSSRQNTVMTLIQAFPTGPQMLFLAIHGSMVEIWLPTNPLVLLDLVGIKPIVQIEGHRDNLGHMLAVHPTSLDLRWDSGHHRRCFLANSGNHLEMTPMATERVFRLVFPLVTKLVGILASDSKGNILWSPHFAKETFHTVVTTLNRVMVNTLQLIRVLLGNK